MGNVLYGSDVAVELREEIRQEVTAIQAQQQRLPFLSVVLVGNHPASLSYVKGKEKACQEAGIISQVIRLNENITQQELLDTIDCLNRDGDVDGILVQLPLPRHFDQQAVLWRIDPAKDVDGFHPINVGKLYLQQPGFVPCTPAGIMVMLKKINVPLSGAEVAVLGRSSLVGSPVARLLTNADTTVTLCHSRTKELAQVCARQDIIIAAVGQPRMVKADWVKPGAVVIDVGVNRTDDDKLVGDVDFDEVAPIASWITPVPRGVGPMTITMLLKNTMQAYHLHQGEGS